VPIPLEHNCNITDLQNMTSTETDSPDHPIGQRPSPPAVIWALAGTFVFFEGLFVLSESQLVDFGDLRWEIYKKLAFFDLYFDRAVAGGAVPAEFWTSFLTHAFLHGGMFHLLMNGAIFLALGGLIANAVGTVRFLVLFIVTAMGGALIFGLLASAQGPLVGASGVIFGLIGALKYWELRWIRQTGAPMAKFWRTLIVLAALNAVLFYLYPGEGSLAWEAHLGGFIAGFIIAPVIAPRLAGPSPF
jgi:membrane associated rhomboid family serine protease